MSDFETVRYEQRDAVAVVTLNRPDVRNAFNHAMRRDLLAADVQLDLAAGPERLAQRIPPGHRGWVVIDEIQRVPELLDEVHRLIEGKRLRFALTASIRTPILSYATPPAGAAVSSFRSRVATAVSDGASASFTRNVFFSP